MKSKKGEGMTFETIVKAILALTILVVLWILIFGGFDNIKQAISNFQSKTCSITAGGDESGKCLTETDYSALQDRSGCLPLGCAKDQWCCPQ